MKGRINKNLTQKIIIAIVMLLSFNFIAPTYSSASFGGVLFGPVIDLLAGIGDAVMAVLQVFMDGGETELLASDGFLVKSNEFDPAKYGMQTESGLETRTINADDLDQGWFGLGTYSIPIIKYSPEKIFSNEVPALDANFINPKTDGYSAEQQEKSIAIQLQETISSWYNALRNLVIVGLLSVLLYVGIRMMLTSISSDKAKYKQMLMDWIIALCLLFFLHYVMSFTMTFIEIISDGIKGATDVNVTINDTAGNISFRTNLTGYCRMQVQYKDLGERMVYLIFYIALVVYTFMFTWKYMKRAITMAFLTLMAPLVTLTYPIDKIGDGKAQAFNMWLKEYVFNALLQPFHLIIYSIFLGASMNIAVENPLYAILFLAFITPAEKILRKFFGFDKATTAGATFAGAFGGAAAFSMTKGLINRGLKGLSSGKGGNAGSSGNVRQQKQLTDPNAPDGGLSVFANGGNGNNPQDPNGTNRGIGLTDAENQELEALRNEMDTADYNDMYLNPEAYMAKQDRLAELERNRDAAGSDRRAVRYENGQLWDKDGNAIDNQNVYTFDAPNGANISWESEDGRTRMNISGGSIRNATIIGSTGEGGSGSRLTINPNTNPPQGSTPVRFTRTVGSGTIPTGANGATIQPIRNASTAKNKNSSGEPRRIKGALRVAGKTALGAGKVAGRLTAAAAMGAVGIGMGIAGDDLEDAFTYGLAGASLGWTAAPALANGVASRVSSIGETVQSEYEVGTYGAEEAALRQQDREFVSNRDNRDFFSEAIQKDTGAKPSRAELNRTMTTAAEYNRAGITDLKQINKSMKLEQQLKRELQDESGMTEQESTKTAREQAMTIAKIANSVDAKDLRDSKKVDDLRNSFMRELQKNGMTDRESEGQANRIIDMVKQQKKVY